MMRATVEEAHCVGCGMCVDVCPQIFSFTEQHRAQGGYVSPQDLDDVLDAALDCPVAAISVQPQ
ncbi:ferredoxin [Selenomonas sp.]|jgi:ferredoxin|uniref:ferredoxin n=1 Tax=Selenomonas sp. TaxID=2053611 RepID=UPI003A0FFB8C